MLAFCPAPVVFHSVPSGTTRNHSETTRNRVELIGTTRNRSEPARKCSEPIGSTRYLWGTEKYWRDALFVICRWEFCRNSSASRWETVVVARTCSAWGKSPVAQIWSPSSSGSSGSRLPGQGTVQTSAQPCLPHQHLL